MTARFSQMQAQNAMNASILRSNSQLKASKSHSMSRPSSQLGKNTARSNIKENTKNLQGEIRGVDEEIAMLQDCLLNVSQKSQLSRSATRITYTPSNAKEQQHMSQTSKRRQQHDPLNDVQYQPIFSTQVFQPGQNAIAFSHRDNSQEM